MSSVNVTKNNTDKTVLIFDQFYEKELVISQADYDLVNSFFRKYYSDSDIANDFTSVFFQIVNGYKITVEELLAKFRETENPIQIDQMTAYYLNGLRSKATLVGVNVVQNPSFYAARNVLP